jgi:uncharacterized membrane protein YjjP (DUF1212 family)
MYDSNINLLFQDGWQNKAICFAVKSLLKLTKSADKNFGNPRFLATAIASPFVLPTIAGQDC